MMQLPWMSSTRQPRRKRRFTIRGYLRYLFSMVLCLCVAQSLMMYLRSPTFFEVHISVVDDCSSFWHYMDNLNSTFWDTYRTTMNIRPIPDSAKKWIPRKKRLSSVIDALPLCSDFPDNLVGRLNVSLDELAWEDIENELTFVQEGGRWRPTNCRPRHKIAIIIPFRKRSTHLKILLRHLHPMLKRQLLDYTIYISEQDDVGPFNRGMIKNIGALHAMEMQDFDCILFHDVDLVPIHDHNLYYCHDSPRHLSIVINDTQIHAYPYHFGGVVTINRDQLVAVNGYSNAYFKWGSEDDDLSKRIRANGYGIEQNLAAVGQYLMAPHIHDHGADDSTDDRWRKIRWGHCRYSIDGLNSLQYVLHKVERKQLYTRIFTQLNETEVMRMIPLPPPQDIDENLSTVEKYKYFGKPKMLDMNKTEKEEAKFSWVKWFFGPKHDLQKR